jgi:hypothetical protein
MLLGTAEMRSPTSRKNSGVMPVAPRRSSPIAVVMPDQAPPSQSALFGR